MGNSNNTINKIENINGPSNVDFSNHSSIIFIEYEKATIKISLNLSESISQLKKHIEEIIGVKKKDQALYFNHKLLSDNFKLYYYLIKEKSKITLFYSSRRDTNWNKCISWP